MHPRSKLDWISEDMDGRFSCAYSRMIELSAHIKILRQQKVQEENPVIAKYAYRHLGQLVFALQEVATEVKGLIEDEALPWWHEIDFKV
jgi:hypothetical protein